MDEDKWQEDRKKHRTKGNIGTEHRTKYPRWKIDQRKLLFTIFHHHNLLEEEKQALSFSLDKKISAKLNEN